MQALTNREKTLLTILFTFLFAALGIMYWVLPTRDNLITAKNNLADLELQKHDMEITIAQTNKNKEDKENLLKDVDGLMNYIAEPLHGENFDLISQKLAKTNGLEINSIQYGVTEVVSPSAIMTPVEEYEHNLKELVAIYTGHKDEETEDYVTEHEVLKKTVTMEVTGSYLSVQKMLSDLNNLGNTYYVRSMSYLRSESEVNIEISNPVELDTVYLEIEDMTPEVLSTTETIVLEGASIVVDVYFLDTEAGVLDNQLNYKG